MKIFVKFAVFSTFSYSIFVINFLIKTMKTHSDTQFFMLHLMVILDRAQCVQMEMQVTKVTQNDSMKNTSSFISFSFRLTDFF
jgi:hypothetical protein